VENKQRLYVQSILFLLPALVLFFLFIIYPILGSIRYSFTDWNGISQRVEYVGLANYIEFFHEKYALDALRRTFVLAIYVVVVQNAVGLLIAELLDRGIRAKKWFRAIYFAPGMLSTIIVAYLWNFIYSPMDGVLVNIFKALGLERLASIKWLADPDLVLYSIGNVMIWQSFGFSMLLYIAGMQSISEEYYEAARLDGASGWKVFRHVKFPLLAPVFTINIVLSVMGALKQFDHIFLMTGGGPGKASQTMTILIFDQAFGIHRFGYGTALSVILVAIILVLSLVQLRLLQAREVEL